MLRLQLRSQSSLILISHFFMNHNARVLTDQEILTLIMSYGHHMMAVTVQTAAISVSKYNMYAENRLLPASMVKILSVKLKEFLALAPTWTMNAILVTSELVQVDLVSKRLRTLPPNRELSLLFLIRKTNAKKQALTPSLKVTERFLEIFALEVLT